MRELGGRFPQVSGLVVEVDLKEPVGQPRQVGQGQRPAARSGQDLQARHQRLHGPRRRRLSRRSSAPSRSSTSRRASSWRRQVIDYVTKAGKVAPEGRGPRRPALIARLFHVAAPGPRRAPAFFIAAAAQAALPSLPGDGGGQCSGAVSDQRSRGCAILLDDTANLQLSIRPFLARLIALGPISLSREAPPPLSRARPGDLVHGPVRRRVHLLTFGYIAWEQRNRLIQRNEEDIAERRLLPGRSRGAAFRGHGPDARNRPSALVEGRRAGTRSKPRGRSGSRSMPSRKPCPISRISGSTIPSGRLRLTSAQFPPPASNASGRDAFSAQASEDTACSSASRSSGGSRRRRPS